MPCIFTTINLLLSHPIYLFLEVQITVSYIIKSLRISTGWLACLQWKEAISEAQCRPLLWAYWAINIGRSQINHCKDKFILLHMVELLHNLHFVTLSMDIVTKHGVGDMGRWLAPRGRAIVSIRLFRICFAVDIQWGYFHGNISTLPIQEGSFTYQSVRSYFSSSLVLCSQPISHCT